MVYEEFRRRLSVRGRILQFDGEDLIDSENCVIIIDKEISPLSFIDYTDLFFKEFVCFTVGEYLYIFIYIPGKKPEPVLVTRNRNIWFRKRIKVSEDIWKRQKT